MRFWVDHPFSSVLDGPRICATGPDLLIHPVTCRRAGVLEGCVSLARFVGARKQESADFRGTFHFWAQLQSPVRMGRFTRRRGRRLGTVPPAIGLGGARSREERAGAHAKDISSAWIGAS